MHEASGTSKYEPQHRIRRLRTILHILVIGVLSTLAIGTGIIVLASAWRAVSWTIGSSPYPPRLAYEGNTWRKDFVVRKLTLNCRQGRMSLVYNRHGPYRSGARLFRYSRISNQLYGYELTMTLDSFDRSVHLHAGCAFPGWALAVLLGIYPLFLLATGRLRWPRRKRPGLCVYCSYDLTGNTSGTCPECGKTIPEGQHVVRCAAASDSGIDDGIA